MRNVNAASLVVKATAAGIPLILAVYWPLYAINTDLLAMALRPVMLVAALVMGVCLMGQPLTRAEFSLIKLFGLMALTLLVTSIAADDPMTALAEWFKLVLIQLFALLMVRALRHGPTAQTLAKWMAISSVMIGLYMVYVYLHMMGPVLPTYTSARALKGLAEKQNVPLNTIPFAAIVCYLCAVCILPMTRWLWAAGIFLVIVGSTLTGSRAILGVGLITAIVLLALSWIRSADISKRVFGWIMLMAGVVGVLAVMIFLNSRAITAFTEGRWDLWRAASQKFLERPLMGYGFLSWKDDLVSRLPGEYKLTRSLSEHIAGGYHNEYMTALAEQGVVGASVVFTLYFFLVRTGWKLAFNKSHTWTGGKWALFAGLFLTLRANVEIPGLFGSFQEPADYLAYILLAVIISRMSYEEDYVRAATQVQRSSAIAWAMQNRPRSKPTPIQTACEPALGAD